MADQEAEELREAVPALLAWPEPVGVPDEAVDRRAAVTIVLSPAPDVISRVEALFIQRAELERDPWSGHIAFPGGRVELDDADLLRTAQRELEEETGLVIARNDYLGRLDDLHPRSQHLPSIAVTPFVAWLEPRVCVQESGELAGHYWVPLSDLASPALRSSFQRNAPIPRRFETMEVAGITVWGMTLTILDNFLDRISAGGR